MELSVKPVKSKMFLKLKQGKIKNHEQTQTFSTNKLLKTILRHGLTKNVEIWQLIKQAIFYDFIVICLSIIDTKNILIK